MLTAQNLLRLLDGSRLALTLNPDKVQDAYSIRCVPQIHGASRDAIRYVWDILSREINAVTDNPLIFPEEDKVISGGNFHGQPVALAMDFLGIALSEYANVSERRLERMVNPALSNGLPAFLTKYGGVHSGFMITQYAAASMVSENKVYAHPASVDSIPSSANQEDHVSMGTTAARKARMILDNSQKVVGIELACRSAGAVAARRVAPCARDGGTLSKNPPDRPAGRYRCCHVPADGRNLTGWSSRVHCLRLQSRSAADSYRRENCRLGPCMDTRPGRQVVSLTNDDSHMNRRRKYYGKAC